MDIMISAEELNQLLFANGKEADIAVFDCRFSLADFELGQQLYEAGHIPRAQHLDMEQHMAGNRGVHGGRHPLPTSEEFTETMQQMGVNGSTLVVAYDDNRLAGAARLWWLLQYFGHEQVRILDGGLHGWQAKEFAETIKEPIPERGNFQANPAMDQTRDFQWLNTHSEDESLQLIDSREEVRFQGQEEPIDPFAGRIPGALNYPWQGATTEQGFTLPTDEHQQRWQDLDTDKEILVYCGSGVTACVNLLSLKLAGIEGAKVYPGSWSDWCSYPESPKSP